MVLRLLKCLLVFLVPLSASAFATNILISEIKKTTDNQWTVSYRSKTPIKSVQFAITPDNSRHSRWSIIGEGYEFQNLGGKDTVFRRDGKPFNKVSFALTPTYIHLPKNYAPFSPFSDGSMLFHSGRFFACADICSGSENIWYLKFNAPEDEIIVLNGQQAHGQVSWYDKNDGRKLFVGKIKPTVFSGLLAVIDPAIKEDIRQPLQLFLPKAIEYLSRKVHPLSSQPMLFASFGRTEDGRYGRQGGVLPEQVFMHWYGKIAQNEPFDLLWFFAHETAHIFQHLQGIHIDAKDAWIHEGHADFIAAHLLLNFYPEAKPYVETKLASSKTKCQGMLAKMPLNEFAENGQFSALYDCGLNFYDMLVNENSQQDVIFSFWKALAATNVSRTIDAHLVKQHIKQFADKETVAKITAEMGWQH